MSSDVSLNPPGPVQLYVYGRVPPVMVKSIAPPEPAQEALVTVEVCVSVLLTWPTVIVAVMKQPLASVIVTVYPPAARLLMSSDVSLNPPGPVQLNVYGDVPPVTAKSIEPVGPAQDASTTVGV